MSRTVDELAEEVRQQTDEFNITNLLPAQILTALNRAQRHAANITSRKYEDLFWKSTEITTTATSAYNIPAAANGRRIEMITVLSGTVQHKLKRISNHQKSGFQSSTQSARPAYYTLTKNKIELYPTPSAGLTVTIHYNEAPERMVSSEGRISSISTDSNYVLVDTLGDNISTSVAGFSSYVNFVDYTTGEVRGSAQVSSINTTTKQITFKSSGLTRSTVLGKTIGTTLPDGLAADDYVCLVTGTCMSELPDAYTDYIVQHATLSIRRRFGEVTQEDFAELKEMENELVKMWVGRESSTRIRKASSHWHSASTKRMFT